MKILYAEDNEQARYLLKCLFEAQGYDIETVVNGEEALKRLQEEHFDLIFSDILMPRMDGFSLCYTLKSDPHFKNIPFIFYSATYTRPEDIRFAMKVGADHFLCKPTPPEDLLLIVASVLDKVSQTGTAQTQLNLTEFLSGHSERLGAKLDATNQKLEQMRSTLDKTRHDLDESRRILGLLVDHTSDAVLIVNHLGQFLSSNARFKALLDLDDENLATLTLDQLLPEHSCRQLLSSLEDTSSQHSRDFHEVFTVNDMQVFITAATVRHEGQLALLIVFRNLLGYGGSDGHIQIHQQILKNLTEGVVITDEHNHIISVNPAFTRITGYSNAEVLGKNPRLLKSGSQDLAFYRRMWAALLTDGQWQGEVWNRRKNGEMFPEWLFITIVRDTNNNILFHIGIFSDISEHEEARKRIEHLAHHDPLTDTPNRTLLRYRLNEAIHKANLNMRKVALLFLDIDRFKNINDSLGHQAGDEVIKIVAQRLKECVRQADTVGRQGGDEFVVVLSDLSDSKDAGRVANKILLSVAEPCQIENKEVLVTFSIGIALFPDDGLDDSTLIKNADAALYKAKAEGRNNYQLYHADLNRAAEQRLTMENALHHAVERGELRLVYQPQVRMIDNRLIGCEVLVRWRHRELGDVPPSIFIPLAEEIGKINSIGGWILREACFQAAKWHSIFQSPITYAVNLSAIQFRQPNLIQEVNEALADSKLPANCLELELTEGILMREAHNTLETLQRFKKMDIQLSIDDFGTGYSNLAYLNRFSVNKLKIDQSFVSGLPYNVNDIAIVKAIIQMAHSLGLVVIAEGVETNEQRNILIEMGCEMAQGYLFAKPLEADEFEKVFNSIR